MAIFARIARIALFAFAIATVIAGIIELIAFLSVKANRDKWAAKIIEIADGFAPAVETILLGAFGLSPLYTLLKRKVEEAAKQQKSALPTDQIQS